MSDTPIDLQEILFDPSMAMRLPPNLMVRRRFLPLMEIDGICKVALERPLDRPTVAIIERQLKLKMEFVLATRESIIALQEQTFGNLREALSKDRPGLQSIETSRGQTEEDYTGQASVDICDQLLKTGIIRRASDLHFQIRKKGELQVKIRVDGNLEELAKFPAVARPSIFNRIKVLAGLDISEKRASQDGSFSFEPGNGLSPYEVRVATIPARFGERITLRLLARHQDLQTLDHLGFNQTHRDLFSRSISLNHGMILLTGPTGSGKSTTLHAAMKYLLQQKEVNVMTVEDPIEYELEEITQTEVDRRREKVSFASSLRSILRHDPDVVMIGEIRDMETAEMAVRASLTGHLVLSTLHTNTAVGAVTRLADLGIDRFLLASVLRLLAAQRLVRKLCPHCRIEDTLTAEEQHALRIPPSSDLGCYRPGSCLHCAGRGYTGRMGLFELVPLDETASAEIISASLGELEPRLARFAREAGHESLIADGLDKIRTGEAPVGDVISKTLEFVTDA